jgi:hypothetical protein
MRKLNQILQRRAWDEGKAREGVALCVGQFDSDHVLHHWGQCMETSEVQLMSPCGGWTLTHGSESSSLSAVSSMLLLPSP